MHIVCSIDAGSEAGSSAAGPISPLQNDWLKFTGHNGVGCRDIVDISTVELFVSASIKSNFVGNSNLSPVSDAKMFSFLESLVVGHFVLFSKNSSHVILGVEALDVLPLCTAAASVGVPAGDTNLLLDIDFLMGAPFSHSMVSVLGGSALINEAKSLGRKV